MERGEGQDRARQRDGKERERDRERERLSENKKEREHFSLSRGATVGLISKGKGNRGAIVLSLSPFSYEDSRGRGARKQVGGRVGGGVKVCRKPMGRDSYPLPLSQG